MKTLREKASDLVDELTFCDFRTSQGVEKAERLVAKALKEVSRDTRHACAEAVVACDRMDRFARDYAHAAVMNTQVE